MKRLSDVVWMAVISAATGLGAIAAAILSGDLTLGLGLVSISAAVLATNERR